VEEAVVFRHWRMNPSRGTNGRGRGNQALAHDLNREAKMEEGEVISHLHMNPNRETRGRGRDNQAVAHESKQRDMWKRER
jgi:hypothetical protein